MKLLITLVGLISIVAITLGVLQFREEAVFTGDLNEHVTITRDGYDLAPLKQVDDLNVIAQMKCEDMVKRNYYAHINPNGKQAWEQYNFGTYKWAGENIARGYRNAMDTVQGWRESPTHLANLTNPNYSEVGYGVCKNNDGYFVIVQVFRG